MSKDNLPEYLADPIPILAGKNISITPTNAGIEISAAADGKVKTVNNQQPDSNGNVQLTAANIGALANNASVVYYIAQALNDTQKAQARTNIGAGTSSFSGNYTDLADRPTKLSAFTNDSGYVTGPSASTANAVPRYDGTTGKKIKNSGVTISDANVLSAAQLAANIIETGTGDNNYFQSRKFRGEGNAATYYHAVDFGFAGHNQVDFYEYGGL